MKLKLETVILFVQDIHNLKGFYVEVLKLEVIEEIESEWILLKAGSAHIGLHQAGTRYLENKENLSSESNTKMVFEIKENIHDIREQLIQQKVRMQEVKSFEDYPYLTCDGKDPEGNVFQLKQKKTS